MMKISARTKWNGVEEGDPTTDVTDGLDTLAMNGKARSRAVGRRQKC